MVILLGIGGYPYLKTVMASSDLHSVPYSVNSAEVLTHTLCQTGTNSFLFENELLNMNRLSVLILRSFNSSKEFYLVQEFEVTGNNFISHFYMY